MINEEIKSREKLIEVLEKINSMIKKNELIQVFDINDFFCTKKSVTELLDSNEFPDIVNCYFYNSKTNEKTLLSVETYHGVGGSYKTID